MRSGITAASPPEDAPDAVPPEDMLALDCDRGACRRSDTTVTGRHAYVNMCYMESVAASCLKEQKAPRLGETAECSPIITDMIHSATTATPGQNRTRIRRRHGDLNLAGVS